MSAIAKKQSMQRPPDILLIERPRHDDLVADIGMDLATMRDDRGIDVEEEAGEQTLHAELAHRLGKRGRAREIEKHQHARFPHRAFDIARAPR